MQRILCRAAALAARSPPAGWTTISIVALLALTAPFYLAAPAEFAPLHLSSKLVSVLSSMRHPSLVVTGLSAVLALACLALPLRNARTMLSAAGFVTAFPTYVVVILWLTGTARSTAIEYFAAGLTATGFYVAALSFSLDGRDIDSTEAFTGASSVTTGLTPSEIPIDR